jgi:hypothetical protein
VPFFCSESVSFERGEWVEVVAQVTLLEDSQGRQAVVFQVGSREDVNKTPKPFNEYYDGPD